jgi:hypothetical protein
MDGKLKSNQKNTWLYFFVIAVLLIQLYNFIHKLITDL